MYDARRPQSILVGTLSAKNLAASGDFAYSEVFEEDGTVSRLFVKVTTTLSSGANTVVSFYARPTYGSSSGQVTLGAVSIPTATAANVLVYKNITPVSVPANYQVVANVSTIATSSGAGLSGFLAQYGPEVPGNMSMTESA